VTHAYDNIGGPGTTHEDNTLLTTGENKIPDVQIRVLLLDPCDFDWEEDRIESTDGTIYRGSQGTDILVATAALAILTLATNGRITPKRIWELAVKSKRLGGQSRWYSFDGIEYYEGFRDGRGCGTDPFPNHTPGFPHIWNDGVPQTVSDLENLGDIELIIRNIIWEGRHWIWIRPDWYVCWLTTFCVSASYISFLQLSR
jgi:hypothetical protein